CDGFARNVIRPLAHLPQYLRQIYDELYNIRRKSVAKFVMVLVYHFEGHTFFFFGYPFEFFSIPNEHMCCTL
ncbi:unnamed protein product, partial [Thlaspi arvense]